jgi:hypothetical protein
VVEEYSVFGVSGARTDVRASFASDLSHRRELAALTAGA